MKEPWYLAFLIIPLFIFFFEIKKSKNKTDFFYTVSALINKEKGASVFKIKHFCLTLLYCISMVFLAVSLSSPAAIYKENISTAFAKPFAGDTIFLFDISNSMIADDGGISRLEKSKQAAYRLTGGSAERYGIVVFKGDGFLLVPLTGSKEGVLNAISLLEPDIYSETGTDIGKGLLKAILAFPDNENTSKKIYLFTDGEEPEKGSFPSIQQAISKEIEEQSIELFVIPPENKEAFPVGETGIVTKTDIEMINKIISLPSASLLEYKNIFSEAIPEIETVKARETDLTVFFAAIGFAFFTIAIFLRRIKWQGFI